MSSYETDLHALAVRVRDSRRSAWGRPRPGRSAPRTGDCPYSRAEIRVLGQLVEGFTDREIAARLYLSEQTVKTHVKAMLAKTDEIAHTRTGLACNSLRRGWVA